MPEQVEMRITEIASSKFCTASEDGQKVHARIAEALRSGCTVRLSFKDVQDLTSAFLNSAVGQLYGEFTEAELRAKLLPPIDASADDLTLLKRVVDRAKEFFQEPERFKKAAQEALGEGDDGKSN
jgi:hypothetical protein